MLARFLKRSVTASGTNIYSIPNLVVHKLAGALHRFLAQRPSLVLRNASKQFIPLSLFDAM